MTDLSHIQGLLDVAVACTNLIGVPVAIAIFATTKRRERMDRENGTYATLNQQYVDFLKLVFDHPQLPIYGTVDKEPALDAAQERQVECAFLILISLIENAYLLYRQHGNPIRAAQWVGWRAYILDYFDNPVFRRKWPELGDQFDQDFFQDVSAMAARPRATAS